MSRTTIDENMVKDARNRLIAKGINPSIDAVRVELGNTGSKTTINKYLKKIEQESTALIGDALGISEGILNIVKSLADKLNSEASDIVEDASIRHQNEIMTLTERLAAVRKELEESNTLLSQSKETVSQLNSELDDLKSNHRDITISLSQREQEVVGLKALLKEKDEHISSIDEKHDRAREALDHYRASVKTQRETDKTRHDNAIQALNNNLRQADQTLSIKNSELSELNSNCAILVGEKNTLQKELSKLQTSYDRIASDNTSLNHELGAKDRQLSESENKYNAASDELSDVASELVAAKQQSSEQAQSIIQLKAEAAANSDIVENLKAMNKELTNNFSKALSNKEINNNAE